MNPKTALSLAGIIFCFVALMHLLRWLFNVEVIIGGIVIPMWVSMLGFIIPTILALCMFAAINKIRG